MLFTAVVLACALYLPNLRGEFIFDDSSTIVDNEHVHVTSLHPYVWLNAMLLNATGPLKRPLAFASFALNYYLTGLEPFYFKLFNLALHLLCGLLVWVLCRRLLIKLADRATARFAAAATTAIWLLHPLQLTVVLYAVQRMTSMMALFCLAGMICYVSGRERLGRGKAGGAARIAIAFLVCAPLAVLSKENGALLPLYLLLIEVFFFRDRLASLPRRVLLGVFTATVLVPIMLGAAWLAWQWDTLNQGVYRSYDYGPLTRLFTEARILWQYLQMILMPDSRWFTLYHDDISLSWGLLEPWTTLPAVLGIAGIAVVAWLVRRRAPVAGFGIAFFLAGHLLESTVLPLELVFEHRNYLPALGPLLVLCHYLPHPGLMPRWQPLRWAILLILAVSCALITWPRADAWGRGMPYLQQYELSHNPYSYRAHRTLGKFHGHIAMREEDTASREKHYQLALYHLSYCTEEVADPVDCLLYGHRLRWTLQRIVPPSLFADARRHLGSTRLTVETQNEINYLLDHCNHMVSDDCPIPLEQVDQLLAALIDNPHHSKFTRVMYLAPLVKYYMRGRRLPQRSWRLLLELHRVPSLTWTELEVRVLTIYWLLIAGMPELAYQEWLAFELAHPVYSRSITAARVRELLSHAPVP